MKTGIFIIILIGGWAAAGWADVQIPSDGEMNAVETDMIKVSDGSRLILPKGMKTTRIGGQIIVEDPQAFLLRRIEELEKQIVEITAANAKLAVQVTESKNQDQSQGQLQLLQTMLVDLTTRQKALEDEFAQLKEAHPAASGPLPSNVNASDSFPSSSTPAPPSK